LTNHAPRQSHLRSSDPEWRLPYREAALAPGGRQVPPPVFSAWDSATRNAATAVVNSGGSTPPAPPAPCQVTSHVIVAVARKAPPGCPALELV
jgi:hypothetical protein